MLGQEMLAQEMLSDIAARSGGAVNLSPCLLGGIFKATGNQMPMPTFGGVKGKLAYEELETVRFIKKHA